jgi:hypothetical protein
LTESDVVCALYRNLLIYPEIGQIEETKDHSTSIPIHVEVRWYGSSGKLKYRSDIVIVDVSTLEVKKGKFRLPSKGYAFDKPLAIIEVKFRRINGESDKQYLAKLIKDLDKLKKIQHEMNCEYPSYLIALDKKGNSSIVSNQINLLRTKNIIKLVYCHSRSDK